MGEKQELKALSEEVEQLRADVTAIWQQIIALGGIGKTPKRGAVGFVNPSRPLLSTPDSKEGT